jgi:hypothetical protein
LRFIMTAKKCRWCWRKDLAEFRGLTDLERTGFLLLLEWFENFRLRHELPAGRDAANFFWKTDVVRKDRPREEWQLAQSKEAIIWYLKWLEACAEEGADHRSLGERLRAAVYHACSRRRHWHGKSPMKPMLAPLAAGCMAGKRQRAAAVQGLRRPSRLHSNLFLAESLIS